VGLMMFEYCKFVVLLSTPLRNDAVTSDVMTQSAIAPFVDICQNEFVT